MIISLQILMFERQIRMAKTAIDYTSTLTFTVQGLSLDVYRRQIQTDV